MTGFPALPLRLCFRVAVMDNVLVDHEIGNHGLAVIDQRIEDTFGGMEAFPAAGRGGG